VGKGITLELELAESSFAINEAPTILGGLAALGKPMGGKCECSCLKQVNF
jgi:hypothetical protein